jgi:hypothetical protein
MRILTELVGGTVLLLVFWYGVVATLQFLAKRTMNHVDVRDTPEPPDEP